MMMDPNERLKDAVEHSIETLAEHIQPGDRNCEGTVNRLAETLDNDEVKEAIEQSDAAKENAGDVAVERKPAASHVDQARLRRRDR